MGVTLLKIIFLKKCVNKKVRDTISPKIVSHLKNYLRNIIFLTNKKLPASSL